MVGAGNGHGVIASMSSSYVETDENLLEKRGILCGRCFVLSRPALFPSCFLYQPYMWCMGWLVRSGVRVGLLY